MMTSPSENRLVTELKTRMTALADDMERVSKDMVRCADGSNQKQTILQRAFELRGAADMLHDWRAHIQ